MAEASGADPTIATRLKFYINRIMANKPNDFGAPRANARGILINICGILDEEADLYIQNEIACCEQYKATRAQMINNKNYTEDQADESLAGIVPLTYNPNI